MEFLNKYLVAETQTINIIITAASPPPLCPPPDKPQKWSLSLWWSQETHMYTQVNAPDVMATTVVSAIPRESPLCDIPEPYLYVKTPACLAG